MDLSSTNVETPGWLSLIEDSVRFVDFVAGSTLQFVKEKQITVPINYWKE